MVGATPARVDDRAIELLSERLERVEVLDRQGEVLESGDEVTITSGPLTEWTAIFDRELSASGRVRVLIHLLQRWTTVEVEAGVLRKIGHLCRRDLVHSTYV